MKISDFDEFSTTESHNCSANAVCNNTKGSCKTGYSEMDGLAKVNALSSLAFPR